MHRRARSSQPRGRDWQWLGRHRIRTVINLRGERESPQDLADTREACQAAGVTLVHIPILAKVPSRKKVERFLTAVLSRPGPILFHCRHGEDRTGMMSAAYRVAVQGWPIDKALREMARYRAPLKGEKRRKVVALLESLQQRPRPLGTGRKEK